MSDPMGHDDSREVRASIRHALRTATGDMEPDVSHLVAAIPRMMAEARHRRALAAESPLAAVVPLAVRAIPRLAAAAAVLVLLATVMLFQDSPRTEADRQDLDSVLLGGTDAGGAEDLLLGKTARPGD